MAKFATTGFLLLAVLVCFDPGAVVTPVHAGSTKINLARKTVQALPAGKIANVLDLAASFAGLKAVIANKTALHADTSNTKPGLGLEPAAAKEWASEELDALAEIFRDSVERKAPPPSSSAPQGRPGSVVRVTETVPNVMDKDASQVASPTKAVRPPLPLNPRGTKVVAVGEGWEVVPMTAADKQAQEAGTETAAATTATRRPPARLGGRRRRRLLQDGGEEEEGDLVLRKPGGGPVSPGTLSPSQAQRVAALEKKGLSPDDALAAVAATPGQSTKVAYVWYLLQKEVDTSSWIMNVGTPELTLLPQPSLDAGDVNAVDPAGGSRRLAAVTPPTVWAGNNVKQSANIYTPPDGALAVGGGFIVQANNAFLTVRSGTTGAVVSGPFSLGSIFGSSTIDFGDPRAMYDSVNNRFIIAAYGTLSKSSWTYVATSKAPGNPSTAGWYVFRVSNDVSAWEGCSSASPCFGDYPTLGQDTNSVWITTNQFSQLSSGYSYAGVGIWGLSKAALLAGSATVPNYSWFLPWGTAMSFTMQPAKASEAGKMHFMASFNNTHMQYMYASNIDRLNAASPTPPDLSATTYVATGTQLPRPPSPISQGNRDRLSGSDGRMQMCTQAGNTPAADSPLYCTTDMSCQVGGVTLSCVFVAVMAPSATEPYMAVTQRVVLSLADTHVLLAALAAHPTSGQVGVVATGIGRSKTTTTRCASLFFRADATTGTVAQSYAVSGSGYQYDWVNPGRIGDYQDAALDTSNVFYGASEQGYPTTTWSYTNWATNIFKTLL